MHSKGIAARFLTAGWLLALSAGGIVVPVAIQPAAAQACPGPTNPATPSTVTYAYDSLGRLTSETIAETGASIKFTYDANGNLATATSSCGGVANVPALPSWGMALMITVLMGSALYGMRRRFAAS